MHMNFKLDFVQFGGSEGIILSRLFLRLRRENVGFDFLVDRLYGVTKIRRSSRLSACKKAYIMSPTIKGKFGSGLMMTKPRPAFAEVCFPCRYVALIGRYL